MGSHYELDPSTGFPTALEGNSEPFSAEETKACPNCRGSLRGLSRYRWIVGRALLDESTKKFVAWSQATYLPYAHELQQVQEKLSQTATKTHLKQLPVMPEKVHIAGASSLAVLSQMPLAGKRYAKLAALRKDIFKFAKRVQAEEQPFSRVRELVKAVSRRRASTECNGQKIVPFDFDQTVLQTRGWLLASALMIRTEVIAVMDFLRAWRHVKFGRQNPELLVVCFGLKKRRVFACWPCESSQCMGEEKGLM